MAFVQSKDGDSSSSTTTVITPDSTFTAGNFIAGGMWIFNGTFHTISDITDQDDNSLTGAVEVDSGISDGNHRLRMFQVPNIKSGVTALKVVLSGTASAFMFIYEFDEMGASPLDVSNMNQQDNPGTGTDAVTSGTDTNTAQPAMLIGFTRSSSGNNAPAAGTGFGTGDAWSQNFGRAEFKRITVTGSQAATFTAGGATHDFITGMMVALEVAVGVGNPWNHYAQQ